MVLLSGFAQSAASAEVASHSPAGGRHGVLSGPGKVRLCTKLTHPGCHARGTWPYGAHVEVICQKDGTSAVGQYRSRTWYFIANGGRKAFIHSSWVRGEGNVPSCRDNAGAMALRWAAQRVGELRPQGRKGLSINNNQWSGWCAALTHAAYSYGAEISPQFSGNARPRYFAYRSAGDIRPWDPRKAQVGSMVFWPYLSRWGHTAIYAGRGQVITTLGSTAVARPVGIVPVGWFGTPAGYVPPADV